MIFHIESMIIKGIFLRDKTLNKKRLEIIFRPFVSQFFAIALAGSASFINCS